MTPFGARLRAHRRRRGMTMKRMAADLELSPAYLSALEHGHRGRPTPNLVRQICVALELGWNEAEEMERLARASHPRVIVDSAGLSPAHTELANLLAERIGDLDEATAGSLVEALRRGVGPPVRE